MRPTDILRHEHQVILKVLDAAEREARAIADGGAIDTARIGSILDFVRTFADGCHHAKEEDLLFVRLGEKGFSSESGPVAVMLQEHELGREHVGAVAASLEAAGAGDEVAREAVAKHLAGYADLLRQHIFKEDKVLFPMAEETLDPAEEDALAADFARVERERLGEGLHERYEALARELAGR